MKRSNRKRRLALAALLALIVSASAYAYTANITVSDSRVGQGTGNILDNTVTNVHYLFDTTVPNPVVTNVTFDTGASVDNVRARLNAAAAWSGLCTDTSAGLAGTSWDCDVTAQAITALAAANLHVVAG